MQITRNTTGMLAALAVAADPEARDHCVVAIKGTFQTDARGELYLCAEPQPLIMTDEHYGDPATTSVRYECDFALAKPRTDVTVVGKAVAPRDRAVTRLPVRLEVHGRVKELMVHGERRWVTRLGMLVKSQPEPFTEIPLTWERSFGGSDDSCGPDRVEMELQNPVGIGFHPYRKSAAIAGLPVPNIEMSGDAVSSPRDRQMPAGFGCIGRAWQPRAALAGSYDKRWRDERAPYLPVDFDASYFQCAPLDQQFPLFRGGERIRCVNMAQCEVVDYVIPPLHVPVKFRFHDIDVERAAVLDTVIVEPHLMRVMLVWRASVPLRKKLTALQEVLVGELPQSAAGPVVYRDGKPVFARLSDATAWLRQHRGGRG
jgi:hypothetical protein